MPAATAQPATAPPPSAPHAPAVMRLLVSCPDRPGIVAAVSRFLFERGANIVSSDQHSSDPEGGDFFLRMEFTLPPERRAGLAERFGLAVAEPFGMTWRLWDSAQRKRVAILVSRYDHCLLDLLWRWRRDELEAEVVLVASNHEDARGDVESFGLRYHHVPVTKDTKSQAEAELLEVLDGACDVVVLARYMQILSGEFLEPAIEPPEEAKTDFEILTTVSRALGHEMGYGSPADVMDEIAALTPRFVQGVLRDGVHDDVAVEKPREIRVDGRPLAVTMPDRASSPPPTPLIVPVPTITKRRIELAGQPPPNGIASSIQERGGGGP